MKNKKLFFTSLLPFFVFMLSGQTNTVQKTYAISIATLTEFKGDLSTYKSLYKYGNINYRQYDNGTTKIYLQKLNKKNFNTKNEAERVCKSIRKYKRFNKSFVFEMEENVFFNSPKLEMKEKELVITVKLNQEESSSDTQEKSNIYNSIKNDRYWIQLGCFGESKKLDYFYKTFHLGKSDKIEERDGGNCRKYLLGKFENELDAKKKRDSLLKYGNCKLVTEIWNPKINGWELR
jgi:hypothetical protein